MLAISVGGGLAGAAFAIGIARAGGRVKVIERSREAHHKVCGEFLSGTAVALLDHLGVDVWRLGAANVDRVSLADGAVCATAALPFRAAGLSRYRLDEALLTVAAAAGAEVVRDTTVDGVTPGDDGVELRTSRGVFRCDAVALASGKHNVRGVTRPGGPMAGFKMHLEPSDVARRALAGVVQLVALPGGYGGSCLVEGGVLSLAWTVRRDALQMAGTGWREHSTVLALASPVAAALIAQARPLWDKPLAVSGQPYGFVRRTAIAPNVFAVGDQLAVIPSFTGDGTALAMASGLAAARAVLHGEGAPTFHQRMARHYGGQFRIARALDTVIATPVLRRVAMAGARWSPSAVTRLVAATRSRVADDTLSQMSRERGCS